MPRRKKRKGNKRKSRMKAMRRRKVYGTGKITKKAKKGKSKGKK